MTKETPPAIIDLSRAGPGNFKRQRSKVFELLWILVEALLVTNSLQLSSTLRAAALRAFGARIGRGVIIRPRVRVKFPWNLEIGDRCWIGEGVWIHNQAQLSIGHDTVVSQESFLTTGSHDAHSNMDLIVRPVVIGNGVWLTSRCVVLQGLSIGDQVIVTPNSVVHRSLGARGVYGGNPARWIRERI